MEKVVEEVVGRDDVEDDLLLTLISPSSSLIMFSILSISTVWEVGGEINGTFLEEEEEEEEGDDDGVEG